VIDGENGFHVADEQAMAEAVGWLDTIDPARCRASVASRYDVGIVADGYEAVYDRAIRAAAGQARRLARTTQPAPWAAKTSAGNPRRTVLASGVRPAG
jgi:hypothetical protein